MVELGRNKKLNLTDAVAAEVAKHLPEDVDGTQVKAVMDAWNKVREGDDVGTIKLNTENGALAYRVEQDGVPIWSIVHPDGGRYFDAANPSLPWKQLWPEV